MEKKFTKKQLSQLQELNHLNYELNKKGGGLNEDDYERYEFLLGQCGKFLPIF